MLVSTGHLTHTISVILETDTESKGYAVEESFGVDCVNDFNFSGLHIKNVDNYKLTIADRGESYRAWSPNDITFPRPSAASLFIPHDSITYTLELLSKASTMRKKKAEAMLFQKLPAIVGSQFQDIHGTETSKHFEGATCYLSNWKIAVRVVLVQELGSERGNQFYKKFTLFCREKALDGAEITFKKFNDKSWNRFFKVAKKEVAAKRKKLEALGSVDNSLGCTHIKLAK